MCFETPMCFRTWKDAQSAKSMPAMPAKREVRTVCENAITRDIRKGNIFETITLWIDSVETKCEVEFAFWQASPASLYDAGYSDAYEIIAVCNDATGEWVPVTKDIERECVTALEASRKTAQAEACYP